MALAAALTLLPPSSVSVYLESALPFPSVWTLSCFVLWSWFWHTIHVTSAPSVWFSPHPTVCDPALLWHHVVSSLILQKVWLYQIECLQHHWKWCQYVMVYYVTVMLQFSCLICMIHLSRNSPISDFETKVRECVRIDTWCCSSEWAEMEGSAS